MELRILPNEDLPVGKVWAAGHAQQGGSGRSPSSRVLKGGREAAAGGHCSAQDRLC